MENNTSESSIVKINKDKFKQVLEESYGTLIKLKHSINYDGQNFVVKNSNDEIIGVMPNVETLDFFILGYIKGIENAMEAISSVIPGNE